MKTVLIVEDEKLIRQGIRTMVQRSGVPIEVIMECNNGEAALDILKDQNVDVMFTDIRMPKMDGLELVREVQKLSHKPQIVAVSGYDDFAYAVELLRHGVREYILKPVEREKITAILKTLEEEYEQKRKQAQADHQIGKNQIRYLLMNENPDDKEVQLLEQKYEERFFPGGYQVCVAGKGFQMEERENTLYLDELGDGNVCICTPDLAWIVQKNELWQECAGMSMVHKGLRELKTAYREAFEARKRAFYRGQNVVDYGLARSSIPEGIRKESLKQVSEQAWTQRLHLVGTGKTEELGNLWKVLFAELKKERILPEEFEAGITLFLNELEKIYRNLVDEETHQKIEECHNIYQYNNLDDYQDIIMDLVLGLHARINEQPEDNGTQQKIRMAETYIKENYNTDLNMAVVSNYISMNYSLFSYEFKQYTGKNFVNYLKELRIEEAKRLLATTDEKVVEISQMVGYDNEKHFMKIFKSICGVSPSEYRKNMNRD